MDLGATLAKLSELLSGRNRIDNDISAIIGRPASSGHLEEFVAATVFDIELHESATHKGSDGRFVEGPLAGRSVNVKHYASHQGLLDISPANAPDYYFVMTGPRSPAVSSRGEARPWSIQPVFLFNSRVLLEALDERGVKIGGATSVARAFWDGAEIHPVQRNRELILGERQRELLSLFAPARIG